MAWRKCLECGHKVATPGDKCPYCGEGLPPATREGESYGPHWFAHWRALGYAEKTGYIVSGAFLTAIVLGIGGVVLYVMFGLFRFLFGLFA